MSDRVECLLVGGPVDGRTVHGLPVDELKVSYFKDAVIKSSTYVRGPSSDDRAVYMYQEPENG